MDLPDDVRLAARERRREGALRPISEGGDERAGVADHPLSDELVAAMRSLSPSQRVVVFLHYKADLPVREIAELTGSS